MPTYRMVCNDCKSVDVHLGGNICGDCGQTAKFSFSYKGKEKIAKCGACKSNNVKEIELTCPKCGSKNLTQDAFKPTDSVANFVGERDWTRGKTNSEISEYLYPDDRGNFKDPY